MCHMHISDGTCIFEKQQFYFKRLSILDQKIRINIIINFCVNGKCKYNEM